MLGHKTQADATVITREKIHESSVEHGSNYRHWHYETWRFVVDVRPVGGAAFRTGAEQKIRIPEFAIPAVGDAARAPWNAVNQRPAQPGRLGLAEDLLIRRTVAAGVSG